MTAKVETVGGCRVLRVGGRIDFESALDFEQRINSMMQEEGDCFIIELSEVELLSSAGLRVLLSTAKRISHRNASLGLAAPSHVVRQVFEISHFNLLFKIFPSVLEAVSALKSAGATIPLDESLHESRLSETATLEEEPKASTRSSRESRGQWQDLWHGRANCRDLKRYRPWRRSQPPPVARQSEAATVAPLPPSLPLTPSTQAPAALHGRDATAAGSGCPFARWFRLRRRPLSHPRCRGLSTGARCARAGPAAGVAAGGHNAAT